MALMLDEQLKHIPEVKVTQKVQSNGVFVIIPNDIAEKIRGHYFFYPWDENKSEWRLMCSWDTEEKDIVDFIKLLKKELSPLSR
jgi:threonine aldolase